MNSVSMNDPRETQRLGGNSSLVLGVREEVNLNYTFIPLIIIALSLLTQESRR